MKVILKLDLSIVHNLLVSYLRMLYSAINITVHVDSQQQFLWIKAQILLSGASVVAITAFCTVDCSVEYILFCTQIGRYVSHTHHSGGHFNGFRS